MIGAISASSGSPFAGGLSPTGFAQQANKMMSPVAEKLGMSVDEVKNALKGGSSLAELAESKGVSRADLEAAIDSGFGSAPGGMRPPAGAASMIADKKGMSPPPGIEEISSRLGAGLQDAGVQGVDATDLLSQLFQSKDPKEVATKNGLSQDLLQQLMKKSFHFDAAA
jgi:lambda repressor-like predicted transcriptional regulator